MAGDAEGHAVSTPCAYLPDIGELSLARNRAKLVLAHLFVMSQTTMGVSPTAIHFTAIGEQ